MKLDPQKTALLTLDLQKGIIGGAPEAEAVLPAAAKVVKAGRKCRFQIIHVGLGFTEGYPEIPVNTTSRFKRVKDNNLFIKGSESAEFHSSIIAPNELIVHKQRVSAFSENKLQLVLRSLGIQNLVFFGIATSGVVLSTLRRAADLDFQCVVIKDACFDRDEEIHRVLTEKVFSTQATVLTADAFVAEQI